MQPTTILITFDATVLPPMEDIEKEPFDDEYFRFLESTVDQQMIDRYLDKSRHHMLSVAQVKIPIYHSIQQAENDKEHNIGRYFAVWSKKTNGAYTLYGKLPDGGFKEIWNAEHTVLNPV